MTSRTATSTGATTVTTRFELFTLNYARFKPEMGTPVRTSNGAPRYRLGYDLDHSVKEVFPPWALVKGNHPREVFRDRYRAHLATQGVDKMASRFRAIAVATGEPRLVLLCFEAIDKSPDNWCHRTMFAEWWQDMTGEQVRELGPTGPPKPEPTLF